MAKMFNTMKKRYLENRISRLSYQIELLNADKALYQDKLSKRMNQKINHFVESHRERLLEKEIAQLSNDDYLTYHTEDALKKLDAKLDLQKRVVLTQKVRKLSRTEDVSLKEKIENDAIAKINQLCDAHDMKVNQLIKTYHRNLSDDIIKKNQSAFKEAEKAYLDLKDQFQKDQEHLIENQFNLKKDKISLKIDLKHEKVRHLKKALSSVIDQNQKRMTSNHNILEIKHLTMNFGGLKAVDDLSFDVKKGEIFGLIGPNGAGKTTVFNCITQFYKSTDGEMLFKNRSNDVLALTDYKVHNVIKQGIVRTFQNVELIWELSIIDNMLVGAHTLFRSNFFSHSFQTRNYKREEKILKMRAEKILKDLDLYGYKDFYPLGLPYGILKKIELARTLMTNPELIILDEPAAGLNDQETESLAETIKNIQENYQTTIFLVEHDMGLVMSICDTICAISFGKKLAVGSPKEIQNNALVKEAYLGGE